MAAHILERCLTPDDPLHVSGAEYLLGAGSVEQAGPVWRPLRAALEPTGRYSFTDSTRTLRIKPRRGEAGASLRVQSSNGKTAMGIVGCPLAVLDEPGSWEQVGGRLLWDAMLGAQGKPGSPLRLILIGTIAPFGANNWYGELIDKGSTRSTHVFALRGNPDRWDQASELRRCNPLRWAFPKSRAKLIQQRDEAREDATKQAFFKSYMINCPTVDPERELVPLDDWKRSCARPVPPRDGRPFVAVDMGGGLSWTAAAAAWHNGRVECIAWMPARPSIEKQERRDLVPAGFYQKLVASGAVRTDGDNAVPSASAVFDEVLTRWRPAVIVTDGYRWHDTLDALGGRCVVEKRINGSINQTEDIEALRRWAAGGPLAIEADSRALLTAGLSAAITRSNDRGETRMVKDPNYAGGRDDPAAALSQAVGAAARMPAPHEVIGALA